MTGAGRYAELAAAVRSFKAELIKPHQIERIVESSSLSEAVSVLTGGRVTSAEGLDLTSVEVILTQKVIELIERLAAYAPHDSRQLIKLFSFSYELSCVKEILRSIIDPIDPEEALKHIVPTGKYTAERCKELIESRNPNRVIETVENESLKRYLAPKLTGERSGMTAVLAIDQYYYSKLWAASNLPDPLDSQSARGLIGEMIDHLNILLAFRARLVGLDVRSASDLLIPVNYALGHALDEIVESTTLQNLLRILEKTRYAKVFQGTTTLDGGAAGVELALNRNLSISCLNAFAGSPFNVGLALAFIFLKNYELRDIFAIINGKANNLPMDRIFDSLILNAAQV